MFENWRIVAKQLGWERLEAMRGHTCLTTIPEPESAASDETSRQEENRLKDEEYE